MKIGVIVLAVLCPAAALAQSAAPETKAPSVSSEPQVTTASYGDWTVRCVRADTTSGAQKLCEAVQSIEAKGQSGTVAQVALGRPPGADALRITVLLPTNIAIAGGVHVGDSTKEGGLLDLGWRRCLPGGCFADAVAKDEVVHLWRTATQTGRIAYKDGTGRDVAVPFSFRGLAQALEALGKV